MGRFFTRLPSASTSLEDVEDLWKILNTLRLSCLFSILCLCCFLYNKQGKSNEINSVRFKGFLMNEQYLTVLRILSLH